MTAPGPLRAARRLLLVHAHPDDETLATGGTIARYAAEPDTSVTLVTCTLGEQGEVIPAELAQLAPGEADQLGGYRIGELAGACAALGVTDHRFLGGVGRWRDSGMALAGHGVRAALPDVLHPRAFAAPEAFHAQVDALVAVLDEVAPQVVVTYGPDGGYGHPDHVRAHDVTVAALRRVPARLYCVATARPTLDAGLAGLAALPGLPFRMPAPDELPSVPAAAVTVRLDVSAFRAQRIAAMRAHTTQVSVAEHGGAVVHAMSNGVAQPLLDVEEFTHGPAADDLFGGAGVKALGIGLLTLNGALLGAFGVAFTPIFVRGVPVPMGVLFAVLILPWLVLRTGELDRRVAALPLAAWFVVVAVLAVVSPGGDVMVPVWWQSGVLLLGGVGAGLWALRQVLEEGYGHG